VWTCDTHGTCSLDTEGMGGGRSCSGLTPGEAEQSFTPARFFPRGVTQVSYYIGNKPHFDFVDIVCAFHLLLSLSVAVAAIKVNGLSLPLHQPYSPPARRDANGPRSLSWSRRPDRNTAPDRQRLCAARHPSPGRPASGERREKEFASIGEIAAYEPRESETNS
jgi:hypothetical protein